MSDSESGNEAAREAEAKRADRERHKEAVDEVIKLLREKTSSEGKKFLRAERGERLESLPPEKGARECVAYCEAFILGDKESVQETRDQFAAGDLMTDPLSDAFNEAGYHAYVEYDWNKSGDATLDCACYSLYDKANGPLYDQLKKAGYVVPNPLPIV